MSICFDEYRRTEVFFLFPDFVWKIKSGGHLDFYVFSYGTHNNLVVSCACGKRGQSVSDPGGTDDSSKD